MEARGGLRPRKTPFMFQMNSSLVKNPVACLLCCLKTKIIAKSVSTMTSINTLTTGEGNPAQVICVAFVYSSYYVLKELTNEFSCAGFCCPAREVLLDFLNYRKRTGFVLRIGWRK